MEAVFHAAGDSTCPMYGLPICEPKVAAGGAALRRAAGVEHSERGEDLWRGGGLLGAQAERCVVCDAPDLRLARGPGAFTCRACAMEGDLERSCCTEAQWEAMFPRGTWPPRHIITYGYLSCEESEDQSDDEADDEDNMSND